MLKARSRNENQSTRGRTTRDVGIVSFSWSQSTPALCRVERTTKVHC